MEVTRVNVIVGFTELMDTKCLPSTPQSTAITCNSHFLIGTETQRNTMIEETRTPIYFYSRSRSWKPAYYPPACTTGFPTDAHRREYLVPSLPWLLDCVRGQPQKAPAGTAWIPLLRGKWKVSVVQRTAQATKGSTCT